MCVCVADFVEDIEEQYEIAFRGVLMCHIITPSISLSVCAGDGYP